MDLPSNFYFWMDIPSLTLSGLALSSTLLHLTKMQNKCKPVVKEKYSNGEKMTTSGFTCQTLVLFSVHEETSACRRCNCSWPSAGLSSAACLARGWSNHWYLSEEINCDHSDQCMNISTRRGHSNQLTFQ